MLGSLQQVLGADVVTGGCSRQRSRSSRWRSPTTHSHRWCTSACVSSRAEETRDHATHWIGSHRCAAVRAVGPCVGAHGGCAWRGCTRRTRDVRHPRRTTGRRAARRAAHAESSRRCRCALTRSHRPHDRRSHSHRSRDAGDRVGARQPVEAISGRTRIHARSAQGHPLLRWTRLRCRRCGVHVSRAARRADQCATTRPAHRRWPAHSGRQGGRIHRQGDDVAALRGGRAFV